MKRIRGFCILTMIAGGWNLTSKSGQWQILPEMVPKTIFVESSWHRAWRQSLEAYSNVLRTGGDEEVVIISAKQRIVLAVIGDNPIEGKFIDASGESLWKSSLVRSPQLLSLCTEAGTPAVYFNCNHNEVAWVEMLGAEKEVPCSLSFLERRARKNPDGIYGRVIARRNELRDYFRRS